jgi:hypothetical protein
LGETKTSVVSFISIWISEMLIKFTQMQTLKLIGHLAKPGANPIKKFTLVTRIAVW